ncbi:hypothetical protein FYK55_02615 [Roseiconus nitratireducens]|uniref:Uncharacterized protein n=1 Tax=Roseiconus nitratireducens TaxID=2605748 RepID=A0A5M6DI97_9BACT|nr:hypothetical protein [Roseiconus nitratireducens]KAA5547307.1 hypothetical protein FYK55_02615 [Roseiconus nitratireducens]
MPKKTCTGIEFIGGPFDGHVEALVRSPEELPELLVTHVNQNVFRLFEGADPVSCRCPTSVVFYRRQQTDDGWVFRFGGAVAPRELK